MKWLTAMWLSVVLGAALSIGASAQKIKYVGSTLWSDASDVEVVGDYAYCAFFDGLGILDVSDPANPVLSSQVYVPFVDGGCYYVASGRPLIDVAGDFAYLANGAPGDNASIQIIDISEPLDPELVGNYRIPGNVMDIAVSGHYAYVCWRHCPSQREQLRIIDVADPSHPVLIGSYGDLDLPTSVFISGDYAYVCSYGRGLEILDISDPVNPTYVGRYAQSGCSRVVVSGSYAYVTVPDLGLLVIDTSEPTNPTLAGSYALHGCGLVFVSGDYAYLTWVVGHPEHCGLEIADISDPTNPTYAAQYDLSIGAPLGMHVSDDYAYLATSKRGLIILDVFDSEVPDPTLAGRYSVRKVNNVFVDGHYAYVASGDSTLHVIDMTRPADPVIVGNVTTSGGVGLFVADDYAYLTGGLDPGGYFYNLEIIDVSDPMNPTFAGGYETPWSTSTVFVSGNYAYVVGKYLGLHIVDISDPSNTRLEGSCYASGAKDIFVSGGFAYIAGTSKLHVIDVHDPSNPVVVESVELPMGSYFRNVYVRDGYAYATWSGTLENGLTIYTVSDPTHPATVGTLHLEDPDYPQDVFVSDHHAYLSTTNVGLLQVDVSVPEIPRIVTSYEIRFGGDDVFIDGRRAYVATGHSLLTLEIDTQAGVDEGADGLSDSRRMRASPNPFTTATTIVYGPAATGDQAIDIYDIHGRLVRSFASTDPEGSLTWDGTDDAGQGVASGVYFVRLRDGRQVQKRRVVLAR